MVDVWSHLQVHLFVFVVWYFRLKINEKEAGVYNVKKKRRHSIKVDNETFLNNLSASKKYLNFAFIIFYQIQKDFFGHSWRLDFKFDNLIFEFLSPTREIGMLFWKDLQKKFWLLKSIQSWIFKFD